MSFETRVSADMTEAAQRVIALIIASGDTDLMTRFFNDVWKIGHEAKAIRRTAEAEIGDG